MAATTTGSAPADPIVQLPPFIVEQTLHGAVWRYAEIPGFEILSRCDDATTRELVLALQNAHRLLRMILPERIQGAIDARQALILYDESLWPEAERDAMAAIVRSGFTVSQPVAESARVQTEQPAPANAFAAQIIRPTLDRPVSFFGNLRLTDADTATTFAIVSRSGIDPQNTILTSRYVGQTLGNRAPALPSWFTAGFLSTYGQMKFRERSSSRRFIHLDRMVWPEAIEPASALPHVSDQLIPLREFFADGSLNRTHDPVRWLAQAELFVRWGLDPDGARHDLFWNFVDRLSARAEPAQAFQECFGLSLFEGDEQLSAFLKIARRSSKRWPLDVPATSLLDIRDATWNEVARIKGEWERLVTRYVRKEAPQFERVYLNQAHRTLERAYAREDRDPRLLASLGLLELDAGDEIAAIGFLEEATRQSVIRPRAYFELADLRYDRELARSRNNDGKLDMDQAKAVLDLLLAARQQSPPLSPVYELMADVWVNCTEAPTEEDLAVLQEGIALFPTSGELVYRTAVLYADQGHHERAASLVHLGTQHVTRGTLYDRFEQLSHRLGHQPGNR